ncbi:hypothetical protein GCM10010402_15300 [Actinomadura luteofluorescens]
MGAGAGAAPETGSPSAMRAVAIWPGRDRQYTVAASRRSPVPGDAADKGGGTSDNEGEISAAAPKGRLAHPMSSRPAVQKNSLRTLIDRPPRPE